VVIAKDKIYLS